jgi:hypothetical protein
VPVRVRSMGGAAVGARRTWRAELLKGPVAGCRLHGGVGSVERAKRGGDGRGS